MTNPSAEQLATKAVGRFWDCSVAVRVGCSNSPRCSLFRIGGKADGHTIGTLDVYKKL